MKRLKSKPRVSIIAVNYNGKEVTLALIKSLKRIDYKNYDIIIVDNKSADGSQEALRKIKGITLIENEQPRAKARGIKD